MSNNNNDPMMKWILADTKRLAEADKKLTPNQKNTDSFLDAYNKIKKYLNASGYEYDMKTEHIPIMPTDIILNITAEYTGVSNLDMDNFKNDLPDIIKGISSFDISLLSDGSGFQISIVFQNIYDVIII